jgi:thiamine pyrophosphate-dependent acetolactate synthase large subunit-like protein
MSRSSTAEQLGQVQRQAGVERACGVLGDSVYPFVDGLRTTDGIAVARAAAQDAMWRAAYPPPELER